MIISHKALNLYDKMLFEKAVLKPPFIKMSPMPNEACFLYIIEGTNNTLSHTDSVQINAEESVLMKCGNYVSRMLPEKKEGVYQAIAIHFYPEVIKKAFGNRLPEFLTKHTNKLESTNIVKLGALTLVKKYIDSVLFYFENPTLVNDDLLLLKLKEIILLLLQTDNSDKMKTILSNLFTKSTYTFKEVIESHVFSPLTITELASLTNNSLSSFKRKFKKIYNDSPKNYFIRLRLEKASHLLEISDRSISIIAYDCGFNNVSHFSTSFKEKFNRSPSDYRKNHYYKKLN